VFEFDKYDPSAHVAAAAPAAPYIPFEGGRSRSFLVWGEHCIECAAPACYSSCDLYDARPDRRCRRFLFGAFKNKAFPSAAGYGAELVFKRWGKLEARGNAALLRPALVRILEAGVSIAAPAINRAGAWADRLFKDIRLSYATHALLDRLNAWLHKSADPQVVPDAFVIELYNPTEVEIALLLSFSIDRTRLPGGTTAVPPPVLQKLKVPPGYFRHDVPAAAFRSLIQSRLPFSIALTPGAADGVHLVALTLDFFSFHEQQPRQPGAAAADGPARQLPQAKCVVFDLDNTLWDGILLEGKVTLRNEVLETVRRLDERGILISVASKNAPEDAMERLRAFGLEDYLLYPAIGWGSKSESVRRIAKQLNIGIDAIIFVDDNPFERDEVARSLPGVETLPDSALAGLPDHPRLRGSDSAEAKGRRLMYQQSIARETAFVAFGADYAEFLRSCEIEVEIRPDRPDDKDRIAELVQRTNQLNFSGRKYSRPELDEILSDQAVERYVLSCSDRYGSYGIVGFCLASRTEARLRIEDLMLSCRVQGKYIEKALLHHLCGAPGWAGDAVEINFVPTERNAAARAVLEELGFPTGGSGPLRRNASPGEFHPDFIRITSTYPMGLCSS
jgi:FkbH-like protein